jgi:hypothetical protein
LWRPNDRRSPGKQLRQHRATQALAAARDQQDHLLGLPGLHEVR